MQKEENKHTNEIWKDIEGCEGFYQISNIGRVKSLERKFSPKECIFKSGKNNYGYLQCSLKKSGIEVKVKPHRLVAQHFIPNPENKPQVNHINGIKTDNRVENLEWVTSRENTLHAFRMGLTKHKTKKINEIDEEGNVIREYSSITEAAEFYGVHISSIHGVLVGKNKRIKGKIFKYSENERKKINEIDKDGNVIREFSSIIEAAVFHGLNRRYIWDVLAGRLKQTKGKIFKYA